MDNLEYIEKVLEHEEYLLAKQYQRANKRKTFQQALRATIQEHKKAHPFPDEKSRRIIQMEMFG
jgi:hypothetical protein